MKETFKDINNYLKIYWIFSWIFGKNNSESKRKRWIYSRCSEKLLSELAILYSW